MIRLNEVKYRRTRPEWSKIAAVALIATLAAFVLTGCEDNYREMRVMKLPPELSDCKFYYVVAEGSGMNVVRCPHSSTSTTYRENKFTKTVVVTSD